jgi:NADH-quinone oxidoreductase subunit L
VGASYHLWILPLLPLMGAAINGIFGRRFSRAAVSTIGVGSVSLACAWALLTFARVPWQEHRPHIERVFTWIAAGSFRVDFALYLDPLSGVMMLVVTGVGLLIHIYSIGYMAHEGGYYRFFSYLNLFTFFMLMLVLANNYLLMFVGWEGVGLCSYLLIGFYFLKKSAADAGKKAFIVNRVGDFGFTLGIITLFWLLGSLDFERVFAGVAAMPAETAGAGIITTICLLLLLGAIGKSAQIPLYVWLPDAMEGPTPVSALIHAATMVTAGVYMVARSHLLFERAPLALCAVAVVGAVTALYSATIGMLQTDIKRVLAYSTISQLGYMFLGCGVTAFSAGIFHLVTHAFFKALLFLAAGSVMHAMSGELDMRQMGGLKRLAPYTYWTFLFGSLAISGIFPFAGFFSKDEILWRTTAYAGPAGNWFLWLIGTVTAGLTAFYVFRAFFLTFHGEPRSHAAEHAHESPAVMTVPLMILAGLSLVGGWIGWPRALGGANRFETFLAPVFQAGTAEAAVPAHAAADPTELLFSVLAVGIGLAGIGLAYLLYVRRPQLSARLAESAAALHRLVYNKYYVDEAYNATIVRPIVAGSTELLWKAVDVGVIDGAVNGLADTAQGLGGSLRRLQSGNIRSYAGWVLIGAVGVISFMTYLWNK